MIEREDKTIVNLIAGNFPRVLVSVTLVGSVVPYAKGTVLGIITASGKCALYSDEAEDGTEVARYILAEDVAASEEDTKALVYASGEFNEDALIGLDNAAKKDFIGTPIFINKIY